MKITYLLVMFSFSTTDNLSFDKKATQSHTRISTILNTSANSAIDEDTNTCMSSQEIGGRSLYQTFWWKVDLGGVYNIHRINISFKNYGDGVYTFYTLYIDINPFNHYNLKLQIQIGINHFANYKYFIAIYVTILDPN